jgi:MYXO-CTERM domain-containing protein
VIAGGDITGITAGQIHFPPPVPANPANPIKVFEATWSTANFAIRTVDLATRTTRFDVYISATSPASQSRLTTLMEGAGGIEVVPAPSALALLGLGGLVAGRRRR